MRTHYVSWKLLGLLALTVAVLTEGCGGAGISIIRTDLMAGAIARADTIAVKPAAADATEFLGDFSDDPPSVTANREMLKISFAQKLVSALLAAGFRAELAPEGNAPEGAVLVDMVVEKFDAGSNASRVVLGFGAGASYLLTAVKIAKGGNTVADFTIDASSGGRGGFSGIGNFLGEHIDDSVEQFVNYLNERAPGP